MRQDDRQRIRVARPRMNEVDAKTIERGPVLRPLVELGFALAPVVVGAPIGHEVLKLPERWPLSPPRACLMFRPPRVLKPPTKIGKRCIRRAISERLDRGGRVLWTRSASIHHDI